MTYCRIFKITFPNEFSKENFDAYIKENTNPDLKKDFIRFGVTTSSNQGIYINLFKTEIDAKKAWVKEGKNYILELNL